MSKLSNFLLGVIILFAVVGIAVVSIAVHEYSHMADYKQVNFTDGGICFLNIEGLSSENTVGYFQFTHSIEMNDTANKIQNYTEIKAYSLTAVILFLGFGIIGYFVYLYLDETSSKPIETKDLNSSYDSI